MTIAWPTQCLEQCCATHHCVNNRLDERDHRESKGFRAIEETEHHLIVVREYVYYMLFLMTTDGCTAALSARSLVTDDLRDSVGKRVFTQKYVS